MRPFLEFLLKQQTALKFNHVNSGQMWLYLISLQAVKWPLNIGMAPPSSKITTWLLDQFGFFRQAKQLVALIKWHNLGWPTLRTNVVWGLAISYVKLQNREQRLRIHTPTVQSSGHEKAHTYTCPEPVLTMNKLAPSEGCWKLGGSWGRKEQNKVAAPRRTEVPVSLPAPQKNGLSRTRGGQGFLREWGLSSQATSSK